VDPVTLTRDLLEIINEPYVIAYHFNELVRKHKIPQGKQQVVFFTGIMAVLRSLPVHVYRNNEARIKTIEAVQSILDELLQENY